MNDKKFGILSIAFTFAGCLLGAGYVSGQELWQYFGDYGTKGLIGLVISIILVGFFAMLIQWMSDREKTGMVDRLIIRFDIPWLRALVGFLYSVFYFIVVTIMVAGISSLGYQIFGLHRVIGAALATVFLMVTVYFGFNGAVRIFGIVVPVLVAVAILISIVCIANGTVEIKPLNAEQNPLLGSWYMSALNYASLNTITALGILAPLAKRRKNKKTGIIGVLIGIVLLISIAMFLILAISTDGQASTTDLPMLFMAQSRGPIFTGIYAALLFLAMYGNANATLAANLKYIDKRIPNGGEKRSKIIRILVVGALVFVCSLTGFVNLIATVYPVIGYIGIVIIALLIEHAIHIKKTGK